MLLNFKFDTPDDVNVFNYNLSYPVFLCAKFLWIWYSDSNGCYYLVLGLLEYTLVVLGFDKQALGDFTC